MRTEEGKIIENNSFIDTTLKFLEHDNIEPDSLIEHLNNLKYTRYENVIEYNMYWYSFNKEEKKRSNTAYLHINEIDKSIDMISNYIKEYLINNNVNGSIHHSYSPNHNVRTSSANHFVLNEPYENGRYKRNFGDALCKPSKKFWQLENSNEKDAAVDCQKCLDKMLSIYTKIYNSMKNKPKMK